MGTVYNVLFVAHLVCVIGGFGGLAYSGLYLALASRRGPDALAVVDVNRQVGQLAELLVYAAFLLGLALIRSSHAMWSFSQAWVPIAVVLFVVAISVLHGLIRPAQRRYRTVAEALTAVTVPYESVVPPEVATLDGLARRISVGWATFDLVAVGIVVLMVFKPGV